MAAAVASQHEGCNTVAGASAGQKSETIEIRGALVGMAVQHALGYRFMAADQSVLDMTESIWPTLDDLRGAVAQQHRIFLRGRSRPFPGRRSSRPGTAPALDGRPVLLEHEGARSTASIGSMVQGAVMIQSHVIEIAGIFAGAAVRMPENFRFIAVDPRLEDLDQSEWPSLAELRRVAAHVIKTGRLPERQAAAHKETI